MVVSWCKDKLSYHMIASWLSVATKCSVEHWGRGLSENGQSVSTWMGWVKKGRTEWKWMSPSENGFTVEWKGTGHVNNGRPFENGGVQCHVQITKSICNTKSSKGNFISKCLFGVFDSSKKWTWKLEFLRRHFWTYLAKPTGADILRSFFGRIENTKKSFRD